MDDDLTEVLPEVCDGSLEFIRLAVAFDRRVEIIL